MEKSFRDILSQFLEENEAHSSPETPPSSSAIASDFAPAAAADLGDWRPSPRENPIHQRVLRYKSQVRAPEPAPEPPPPPPPAEALIPLEKLDKDSRLMVGILLDLGASDLVNGVSLSRIKKAYRRLAKTYHPDRLPPSTTPAQKESAKASFYRLQKAYEFLSESLAEELANAA